MTTKLGELEHDVMAPRARARYLEGRQASLEKTFGGTQPAQWLPRLRATFVVEPHVNGGCSTCEGTGVVVNDDPDPEYRSLLNPWDAPKMACPKCDGEGLQLCEADDCRELAVRIVRGGHERKMCCGHAACTQQLITEVLSATWSLHKNVAAFVARDNREGGV